MANPYSKYTGSRISPVPAGYLAAAAQSAEGVRRSGEQFGDMIGAGIAKYYEGKQEARGEEAHDWYRENRGYSTEEGRDEEPSVAELPSAAEDTTSLSPLTDSLRDQAGELRDARQGLADEGSRLAGLRLQGLGEPGWEENHGRWLDADAKYREAQAALSAIDTSDAPAPAPAYLPQGQEAGEASRPAERYIPTLNEELEAGEAALLGMLDEYGDRISSKKKKEIYEDHERWVDRTTNQFNADRLHKLRVATEGRLGAATARAASALTEKVALLDANAEALGWNPEELAAAKVQIAGVMKSGANITADVQRFEAMKKQPFYAKASDDQRDTLDQIFFGVAPSEAAETRLAKEKVDKSNREGFVALLREQAKLPPELIDEVAKLGSFSAMDTWYDNLSDDQKGMMPADVRTWAAIKDGFPAGTSADVIEKYRRIHFKLEEREIKSASEKEMAAFRLINTDPTKTPEEKIRAGYTYGVYSGPETARRYFEEWDANNIGATDEDRDDQRALLGLPTGVEAEHAQVKLELDQIRLADAKKVEAAMAAGTSGVQVMAIPGITSHKFVKMPTQDHWTLINIGTNAAASEPVTQEDRDRMNTWLEGAKIFYRWVEDPTAASGSRLNSMGGFSMTRELMGGGTGSTPSGGDRVNVIGPDGKPGTVSRSKLQKALEQGYKEVK